MMESEPKIEEGKIEEGKGKGKEKEEVYDWEGKEQEQSAISPTPSTDATAPPVPEKDAAPAVPPRPVSQVQPPHGSGHPYPYPVGSYNPDDHVHPSEPEQAFRSKGCHVTKLVLSTASLVFSAGVVGLGIAVAAWGGTYSIEEGIFALTAATAGLAILWTTIDSLIVCLSHGRHRIPPGANVAGHLIIWLMAMVSVIVLALNVQYGYSRSSRTSRINMTYEIRQLESAILVFMVALLLVHFILFIRACVETHTANLASRKNRKHIVRYVHVPVPVDASGAPISLPQGALPPPAFTTMAAAGGPTPLVGYVPPPQGYVPPEAYAPPPQRYAGSPPGASEKSAPLGGYYAPPGAGYPQIDPAAAYTQQSAAMALHGYYGPPPPAVAGYSPQPGRRSSNSGARRSQRRASAGPPSGSGSRRESRQNPTPAPPPAPAPAPAESS